MLEIKNKIISFFQKLSETPLGNWVTQRCESFFEFCIDNAYRLFFLSLALSISIQPLVFGAEFKWYGVSAVTFAVVMFIGAGITSEMDSISRIRRMVFICTSSIFLFFMVTTYVYTDRVDRYLFNNKKPSPTIVAWNPLFKNTYQNVETRPGLICFNVVIKQGDLEVSHMCTVYVDRATWILFDLDGQKLVPYLQADIKKRLIASLGECRLNHDSTKSKIFYYQNGKFVRGKLNNLLTPEFQVFF